MWLKLWRTGNKCDWRHNKNKTGIINQNLFSNIVQYSTMYEVPISTYYKKSLWLEAHYEKIVRFPLIGHY